MVLFGECCGKSWFGIIVSVGSVCLLIRFGLKLENKMVVLCVLVRLRRVKFVCLFLCGVLLLLWFIWLL